MTKATATFGAFPVSGKLCRGGFQQLESFGHSMRVIRTILCVSVLLAVLCCARAATRPATADFAPDRFHFAPMDLAQVGRELPFIYDVPGVAKEAKNDPRTSYSTWIGLGLQALREQDFNVAVDCFGAAIAKTNAAPTMLRHLLARALLLDERPADAEAVWTALCKTNAADAEARWQLGYSLFLRDEAEAAIQQWALLREAAPAHPFPPLMIGLGNWEQKEMAAAEREIIASTRRNKAPAQSFLAIAAMAADAGEWPECVGWLRRAFDRMNPAEQRRWYAKPQFAKLRNSGSKLVVGLETEFALRSDELIEAPGLRRSREGYEFAYDRAFNTMLEFAPLREAEGTNAPPVPDGLQVLRLAPRLVPK